MWTNWKHVVPLGLLAFGLTGCSDNNTPMIVRHRAMLAEQRGDFEAALEIRKELFQQTPDYFFIAEVHFEQGMTFLEQGQWEDALEQFDLAIKRDPEFLQAHIRRCQVHAELGNSDKAIADGNRAVELSVSDRDLSLVFLYQGNSLADLGRLPEASIKWQLSLLLNSGQFEALQELFDYYMNTGNSAAALELISDSLKQNERFALKQWLHARALAAVDRLDEAATALARAHELNINKEIALPATVAALVELESLEQAPMVHSAARPVIAGAETAPPAAVGKPSKNGEQELRIQTFAIARAFLQERNLNCDQTELTDSGLLACTDGERHLEILVKHQTLENSQAFELTQQELEKITQTDPPRGMLIVAFEPKVGGDSAAQSSGKVIAFAPSWQPDPQRLIPQTYRYQLPQATAKPDSASQGRFPAAPVE